jgi:hypothetical protein
MELKPDIGYEYDYIRIVYEVILSNMRTNKKIIEKDLNFILTRIQNLKKKGGNISETIHAVKVLIEKVNELEKKVLD